LISLEEAVVRKIKAAQHILCTVESCTGGLISHQITNVPGASEIYWGSFISYDNSAKEDLGVPSSLIKENGAVSPEVAGSMADQGLRKMSEVSGRSSSYALLEPKGFICISTSGIAGPTGGSKEKPVGLCYIGLAITGKKTWVERFQGDPGCDRVQMKILFAKKALELIRGTI